MLFDPKWTDTKAKPDVFSLDGLIAWLEKKNPTTKYDFDCRDGGCLIDLYLASHKISPDIRLHNHVCEGQENYGDIALGGSLSPKGCPQDQSFGSALSRARKIADSR